MPERGRWFEPEHGRESRDAFPFERGGGGTAVERVVVGVDPLRHRVRCERNLMWRLQHLAGVTWVEERVVLPQTVTQRSKHRLSALRRHVQRLVPLERRPMPFPAFDVEIVRH